MKERTSTEITVRNKVQGKKEKFKVLAEFPFDSTRKRMSLIVKHDRKYYLMTKGADSIIIPRILFRDKEVERKLNEDLLKFAVDGLRTLVMA